MLKKNVPLEINSSGKNSSLIEKLIALDVAFLHSAFLNLAFFKAKTYSV